MNNKYEQHLKSNWRAKFRLFFYRGQKEFE